MNDRDCCALLTELVGIPSPPGGEAVLAAHLRARMDALGFRTRIDRVGNVIGETGAADGPTILLLGHIDAVEPWLPARRDGDVLHGRGAVDAKGPLAALVCAAARRRRAPYRIRVVGAVEEETPRSRGAVEIAASPRADAVVVGEPTGWSSIVFGYKGKVDLTFRAARPAMHSSDPREKATEAVVAFWTRLVEALGPTAPSFDSPSAALAEISGDAAQACAMIACRTPPGFDVAGFMRRLEAATGDGCTLIVDNAVAAVRRTRSDPVVRHLSRSVRAHGGTVSHCLRGGSSDMNTLAAVWEDVPMATYGPGDHRVEHSDEERISLAEYLRSIDVLADALDGLGTELPTHRPLAARTAHA